MYDYRQSRRSAAAKIRPAPRSKRVPARLISLHSRRKPVVHRAVKKSTDNWLVALIKTVVSVGLGILITAGCTYFFITKIATYIWPLTTVQTILLVPEAPVGKSLPFLEVVVLDPHSQTAQVVALSGNLPLSESGKTVVADLENDLESMPASSVSGLLSLKLGRAIDAVAPVSDPETITTHAQTKRIFQELLQTKTPDIKTSDKIRWWLFVLSLSDTDFKAKSVTSASGWQAWLANGAQQPAKNCSLALINTTTVTGLSRFISQVMEQSGYQVIRVDSQLKFLEKSQIFLSPDRPTCLLAAERLKRFLPESIEVVQDSSVTQQARADIVWLLGNDIAQVAAQARTE